jgi:hypothetical protein
MEDEKPDTRHLVLKPKVIVPTDSRSLPGDGTAISVQLIHRENRLAEEKAKRKPRFGRAAAPPLPAPDPAPVLAPVFKRAEVKPLDPPSKPGDEEAIHVPEMLLENRVAEDRSGWGRLKRFKGRKSKRNRDFLIVVGGLDLAIAAGIKFMPGTVTMVYGIAAITLVTSMFGWIMFVVNDDY